MKLACNLLVLSLCFVGLPSASSEWQSDLKMAISSQIESSLRHEYRENLGEVDISFRFPRYSSSLMCRPDTLKSKQKKSLGPSYWHVKCELEGRDQTLRVRAISKAMVKLPVLEFYVKKGERVPVESWSFSEFELKRSSSFLLRPNRCYLPRRGIVPGKPVKVSNLGPCNDLDVGEKVKIVSSISGVTVMVVGELVRGGRWGQRVEVINVNSGAVLKGILEKGGLVRL